MRQYWSKYYQEAIDKPVLPSQFAKFVSSLIHQQHLVFDIGCGNFRDTKLFASLKHYVIAIDQVAAPFNDDYVEVIRADLSTLDLAAIRSGFGGHLPALFYCRFVIHAIDCHTENILLHQLRAACKTDRDLVAFEFRTTEDESLPKATVDHYRRFINQVEFQRNLLALGFTIDFHTSGQGLAIFGNDDAFVCRVIASVRS